MKKLLLALTFMSMNFAMAESYVVELKNKPTLVDKKRLQNISGVVSVAPFTNYKSEYFDRLVVVNTKKEMMDTLSKMKMVALVEENFDVEFFEIKENPNSERVTNDLLFAKQWALYSQGQNIIKQTANDGPEATLAVKGVDIDWKNSIDAIEKNLKRSPIVAVVDMGIDLAHPELRDQLFLNSIECDENGSPLVQKVDRDENKFASDCHGWDFAALDWNMANFPHDDKGHGTHISGIIAAKRNNNTGISGVSDKIKILPVRVTGSVDETSDKNQIQMRSPSQRIANGILYSVYRGVDVINLSLGWPKSMDTNFMRRSISEAIAKGIIVIAAAGNNNTNANIYPCSYYDVVCVGSVDADGKISAFSNFGGEVDILAPGDQIISTIPTAFIPLKMNIQGYDIMSGTSQAAPYVSAVAALLKGLEPESTRDEILRKLYDSALQKPDEYKSLHGLVQLGKAAALSNTVSTKPIFKMLSDVSFNPANGYFMFPLNFRNYGENDSNVSIKVELLRSGIELRQSDFLLEEVITGKPVTYRIEGTIRDQFTDREVKLKVTVSSEKMGEKVYFQDLFFARNILQDDEVETVRFKFQKEMLPLMNFNKEENLYTDNTRTVDTLYTTSKYPDFTLRFQPTKPKDESEDGIKIFLMKHNGRDYEEVENTYFISKARRLLSVTKGDYNLDGRPDYEVATLVYPSENDGYILYSYLDENFRPLLGEYSEIKYRPRFVEMPIETIRYTTTILPNGMKLQTRYFINQGVIPNYNQVHDEWTRPDQSSLRRIYKLVFSEKDKEFETHTIVNQDFANTVQKFMKESLHSSISLKDANFQIVDFLTQDEESFRKGEISAIASFGLGHRRTNFLIDIKNHEVSLRPANYVTQKIDMNAHHGIYNLNDDSFKKINDVFVGFLTSSMVRTVSLNGEKTASLGYEEKDKLDRLVSFMAQFEKGDYRYSMLETIDSIILVSDSKFGREVSRKRTKKFSFLPGAMMSEVYFPISLESNDGLVPAIYVDTVLMSGNQVYVSTVKDNKLISPMNLSVFIPNGCIAKNPVVGLQGGHSYTVLCRGQNGYEVKFIKLERDR